MVAAGLAAYLASLVIHGCLDGWNVVDDALITCRVAANWAAGAGPVFNPGLAVESSSSPGWAALLGVGARMGMDLPWLARGLGVLAALALVFLVGRFAARAAAPAVALAAAVAMGADAGLAVWSQSGLESAAAALLLTGAVLALGRAVDPSSRTRALVFSAACGLLAWIRPEGMLLAGWLLVVAWRGGRGEPAYRLAALAPALLAMAALVAWRSTTYGTWWPSAAASKLTVRPDALAQGALDLGMALARRLPLLAAACLGVSAWRRTTGRRMALREAAPPDDAPLDRAATARLEAILGVAVILTVMVVAAGGDWMGRDRLILPLIPLLVVAAVTGTGSGRPAGPVLLLLTALAVAGPAWESDRLPPHGHAARRLGEWLAREFPESTLLGVAAAGAIPFHAGLPTIDALGITDPDIAATPPSASAPWKSGHMHYDIDRLLAARPDIIVWEFGTTWCLARMSEPSEGNPARRGDYRRELLRHPAFRAGWRPMPGVPPDGAAYFTVFQRIAP